MKLFNTIDEQKIQCDKPFVSNVNKLAAAAKRMPPNNLIGWLNRILAEETRCVMRYRMHYFLTLNHPKEIASVFLIHSNEKLLHVDAIALRIVQLGGVPDFSSVNISVDGTLDFSLNSSLYKLIEENLHEGRLAIHCYRDILNYLSGGDLATSCILENILYADERRVDELICWLGETGKKPYLICKDEVVVVRK